MIKFTDVVKKYGERKVLDHINLEIDGGEFVTLVGPSGAGKSTLLYALIGGIRIDSGSITVDGYEITEFKPSALQEYRRKVGMVFQDYKLLENKTVYENVAFALQVCGWKDGDIEERTYEVLDLVGMIDHSDKFPHQLAGGEGQRTAIARALVHRPKLLIADEPTGNLDYWNTKQILDILKKVNESGTTVLLATHNREVVDEMHRRVLILNQGVIISDKENSGYELDLTDEWELGIRRHEPLVHVGKPHSKDSEKDVGDIEITEIRHHA